jgi:hypothetical protein
MAIRMGELSRAKDWKELYLAALLEGDRNRVPALIVEAERAIVRRARELFQAGGDNIDEAQGLEDALYALHALKSCMARHDDFAGAA